MFLKQRLINLERKVRYIADMVGVYSIGNEYRAGVSDFVKKEEYRTLEARVDRLMEYLNLSERTIPWHIKLESKGGPEQSNE